MKISDRCFETKKRIHRIVKLLETLECSKHLYCNLKHSLGLHVGIAGLQASTFLISILNNKKIENSRCR